jgi:hypothetical protein
MMIVPLAVLFGCTALPIPLSSSPSILDKASQSTGDGALAICARAVPMTGVSITVSVPALESMSTSILEHDASVVPHVVDSSSFS